MITIPKELNSLIGTKLISTERGIGSLISLNFSSNQSIQNSMWMQFADWDFVLDDKDILNSISYPSRTTPVIGSFLGSTLIEIFIFENDDDDEIQFFFDNGGRLAVWANDKAYGAKQRKFFILYENKKRERKSYFTYPEDWNKSNIS